MNNSNFHKKKKSSFSEGCGGIEQGWGTFFAPFHFLKTLGINLSAFLILMTSFNALSQSTFMPEKFKTRDGEIPYQILLPEGFSQSTRYPLVLFLHGSGERGDDNKKQLVHGSTLFLKEENRKKYPAIVIFPQCPNGDYWSNVEIEKTPLGRQFKFLDGGEPTLSMALVLQLLDSVATLKFIDKDRIYIGGLSMGGMGTFEMLSRRPNVFAAAFPICGGGDPISVTKYADKVALWVFHGAKDDVVFPHHSVNMVVALIKAGNTPKFTLYKDANHNSWDPAFAEAQLFPWLFSQTMNN